MKGNKLTLVLITVALFFSLNPGMSSAQNDIHFGVDMTSPVECGLFSQDEGDSVILRGTFNAWAGKDYVLSDPDNDFRYDGKFEIEGDSGTVHEYKYLIQKAGGKLLWEKKPNPENEPHGCRTFHMAGQDQRLDMANFDFDKYYLGSIGKEVIFTVDEMQTDFNMLRQTLEKEHCCLYEYTGKEDFDKLFDHQYSLIKQPMQPYEFYKILTPITAKIGCGHTAVWMPGAYWDAGRENLFPLQIKLLEDDMVVKGYYNDTIQVPYGSIIQEINGRPVFDIITEMRENYSADAFNINFINSQIERRFPLIYARRFDFPDKYTINYQNPVLNMVESAELIPANDLQVREVIFSNFHHPPLTFEILQEKNTAILTIPTFIYYDRTDYFTGFIDSCFTTIKENNINNLILDLRGNDGGDPFCAAPLFSYLQPESLPYFAEPYGKYSDFAEPLPLPENHFTGNLIILVDGRCFSTNGHFCALLKYHNICTFVGTETGSTYICNAGRNGIEHLENTGVQLYFGRSSFAAAGKGMDKSKPIEPDYFINLTYDDFLEGRDLYLEKAMELIENKNIR